MNDSDWTDYPENEDSDNEDPENGDEDAAGDNSTSSNSTTPSTTVPSSPSTPSSASATTTSGPLFTYSPITSSVFTLSIKPSTARSKASPTLTSFPTIDITLHSPKGNTPVETSAAPGMTSVPDACKKFNSVDCSDFDDAASSAACVLNHQKCATMTTTPETTQEGSLAPVEPPQTSSATTKRCSKADASVFCFDIGWPGNGPMPLKCQEMRELCGIDPVT
jgi:hypothetical protein